MAGFGLILHKTIIKVSVNFLAKYVIISGKNYSRLLMLKEKGLVGLIDILKKREKSRVIW